MCEQHYAVAVIQKLTNRSAASVYVIPFADPFATIDDGILLFVPVRVPVAPAVYICCVTDARFGLMKILPSFVLYAPTPP